MSHQSDDGADVPENATDLPMKQTLETQTQEIRTPTPIKSRDSSQPTTQEYTSSQLPQMYALASIQSSLATKASPFILSSWLVMALTLDGRDKITKVLQYSSRFLGYYYESMAHKMGRMESSSFVVTDHGMNLHVMEACLSRAKRFRNLQKSLTKSRKAYRLGRTVIELEKLKKIGFVHWVAWHLRRYLLQFQRPTAALTDQEDEKDQDEHAGNGDSNGDSNSSSSNKEESTIRWHPDTKMASQLNAQNTNGVIDESSDTQTDTTPTAATKKSQALQPPRMKLPRKASSNLGPSDLNSISTSTILSNKQTLRQMSSISRFFYKSLSSFVDEELEQKDEKDAPPMWKVLSTSFKLIGLAGFWLGDNISFLHSSDVLWEDKNASSNLNAPSRSKRASLFASRSYFFAAVSGLYLNTRELINHRNGALKEAYGKLTVCRAQLKTINHQVVDVAYEKHEKEQELERLEKQLEKVKQKHASLCIALLKSCCDVTVFSKMPGIDLHLKYRGKKMNEGVQSVFGITSALTVIYNSYPKHVPK